MRSNKKVIIIFSCIFLFASATYLLVHFAFGIKYASVNMPQDIGKIKYVDGNGNEVFVSSEAIVFNKPVVISDVSVENNVANIVVSDFVLVCAPGYGVVLSCENGVVTIDHGNDTISTITGLSNVGVKQGNLVKAGQPIGSTQKNITFSVKVSELPLDMHWLIEAFNADETK